MGSSPGSGRSPGGGNGSLLQYSCPENTMDRGNWQVTVHRVAQSQTQLKWIHTHTLFREDIYFKGIKWWIFRTHNTVTFWDSYVAIFGTPWSTGSQKVRHNWSNLALAHHILPDAWSISDSSPWSKWSMATRFTEPTSECQVSDPLTLLRVNKLVQESFQWQFWNQTN